MRRYVPGSRSVRADAKRETVQQIGEKAYRLRDPAIGELLDHIAKELARKFLEVTRAGSIEHESMRNK